MSEQRLDRIEDRLGAVEIIVARIEQRLADHIDNPRAHAGR